MCVEGGHGSDQPGSCLGHFASKWRKRAGLLNPGLNQSDGLARGFYDECAGSSLYLD
jgi:hypothetical protein